MSASTFLPHTPRLHGLVVLSVVVTDGTEQKRQLQRQSLLYFVLTVTKRLDYHTAFLLVSRLLRNLNSYAILSRVGFKITVSLRISYKLKSIVVNAQH